MTAEVCGQIGNRRMDPPMDLGCGEPFASVADLYRCAECSVPFHRNCIQRHFDWPESGGGPMPNALDKALAALATPTELELAKAIHAVWHSWALPTLTCMTKHRAKAKRLAAALADHPR